MILTDQQARIVAQSAQALTAARNRAYGRSNIAPNVSITFHVDGAIRIADFRNPRQAEVEEHSSPLAFVRAYWPTETKRVGWLLLAITALDRPPISINCRRVIRPRKP